ncbi:MAG: PQQ-dependent sugar dehydrogenase [Acidimicrobiales bacterium]
MAGSTARQSRLRFVGFAIAALLIASLTPAIISAKAGPHRRAVSDRDLVIRAIGNSGEEILDLEVDGRIVKSFRLRKTDHLWSNPRWRKHRYTHPTPVDPSKVRLYYRNDAKATNGGERDVRVDWVRFGDERIQTESGRVRSAGAWVDGECSSHGVSRQDSLVCNGYFSFGRQPPPAPNTPPRVDAGDDQLVQAAADGLATVKLAGRARDRDGRVVRREWLEGQQLIAKGAKPTVRLAAGSHQLTLRASDDDGAAADDTVLIVVQPFSAPTPPSLIEVFAAGSQGGEILNIEVAGRSVAAFELPRTSDFWDDQPAWTRLSYTHPSTVVPGQVRLTFNNDDYVAGSIDRNVKVDRLVIDGVSNPTRHPSVLSSGWLVNNNCEVAGRFETDLLHCRGFFQFSGGTSSPVAGAPSLDVVEVVTNLDTPWDLGFLPDGSMFFTERPGRLGLRRPNGMVNAVDASLGDIVEEGNTGLLSIAIDPRFESNRRFYTCQSQQAKRFRIIVQAWKLSTDSRTATRTDTLLRSRQDPGHGGCRIRVDGQGFLWVGTGDGYDGSAPQDLTRLAGKTLRIDRFTGHGAPGNPFANSTNVNTRRIYSWGHRNVQGLAIRPDSEQVWSVEHGSDVDDEINLLVAGGNYGWDPVPIPGFEPERPGYDQEHNPMTDLDKFPDAEVAKWSSGRPTVAPSGAVFLEGEQWGSYEGALAVLTLKDSRLRLFFFDAASNYQTQVIPHELEGVYGRLRSPVLGPDGNLYITTSNSGLGDARNDSILRVVPRL